MSADHQQPIYLTTKEVADLLRVKERKVYELATAGEIPHRRITGKLLFPATDINNWIEGTAAPSVLGQSQTRPNVVVGSHDPLLDWALRESECSLATMFNGSQDGLEGFANGTAMLTGMHIRGSQDWNITQVKNRHLSNCVLIAWANRRRGLLLSGDAAAKVSCFSDLKGKRVVRRQAGAGAQSLFDMLLTEHKLSQDDLILTGAVARTEFDAAAAVAAGDADAALGIEAMARQFGLAFLPILDEPFDLLIDRRGYFTDPVQALLKFAATPLFFEKSVAMGGYDVGVLGRVRWLSD